MKNVFFILGLLAILILSHSSHAQQSVLPCYQVSGSPCQVVNSTHGLPVTITGPISSTVNLGTSTSATSPRITGDATSGFYTAGAGLVDAAIGGSKITEWSSTGQTTTGLSTANGFSPTSSTATGNRLFLPSANTPGISANGIEAMQWNTLSSGVDYFSVTPGKSGTIPSIAVNGATTNQSLNLAPAGTGSVTITAPTAGAALDLSANTNSVLMPIGTTGQRPTGVNGMFRYNSTTPGFEGYINGAWGPVGAGSSPVGATLTSGQTYYGNSSNQVAASVPTGDVSVDNTNKWTVLTNNNGSVFGTACAAATGTSGATLGFLNGANTWSTLNTFTANASISGAAQTTLTTSASQGAAGIYVPYSNPSALVLGSIVSGTNVVTGTQLFSVSGGTVSTAVTIPAAVANGQTIVPVTSTTSLFVNQMLIDTTTTTATAGQNAITSIVSGTTSLSTTANGVSNAGQKVVTVNSTTNVANNYVCYDSTTTNAFPVPAIVASFSAGVSITLTTNLANATANNDVIKCYPNITLTTALAGTGTVLNDNGTVWPTGILSQASSSAIASSTVLTYTTNATNYTSGSLNVTGGITAIGDLYVSQGVNNSIGNLIRSPNADPLGIAIGFQALNAQNNPAGYANIAIGYQAMALTNNIAAVSDTAIGYQSMKALTSGTQDTMLGYQAGTAITTGSQNTGIGYQVFQNLTTGSFNTAMGRAALFTDVSAADNTAVGYKALNVETAADNTGIGYQAGVSATGADNTFIGSSAGSTVTSGTNNTIVGFSVGSTTLTTGTGNIMIGTSNGVAVPASGTTNYLNIGNMIVGDTSKGILIFRGPATTLGSCGGGSPALSAGSNDMSGEVTVGTATTSCVINFANTHTTAPRCIVTSQSTLAAFGYTMSTTALTVTATTLGGDVVDYFCPVGATSTNPTP